MDSWIRIWSHRKLVQKILTENFEHIDLDKELKNENKN